MEPAQEAQPPPHAACLAETGLRAKRGHKASVRVGFERIFPTFSWLPCQHQAFGGALRWRFPFNLDLSATSVALPPQRSYLHAMNEHMAVRAAACAWTGGGAEPTLVLPHVFPWMPSDHHQHTV